MEFAIVLPLLVLIVFGCIDFGRFLYVYAALTNAAEEGAAYGSLHPPTSGGWEAGVKAAAVAEPSGYLPVLSDADVTVTNATSSDPEVAGYVTVRVQHTFYMMLPGTFELWGLPTTFELSRTVVMPHSR